MDFGEICSLFGGTAFYDDFRSDLNELQLELSRRETQCPLVSLDETASLLLLRALWNLHSGNPHEARRFLVYITESEVYSPRWKFRGNAYLSLVYFSMKYPPLLRLCDLSGPAMYTWMQRHPVSEALAAVALCGAHIRDASFLDALEFGVIGEVCGLRENREHAHQLNPDSGDSGIADGRGNIEAKVFETMNKLSAMRILASQVSLPAVSAYLSRLMYEISRVRGSPDAYMHLERMGQQYAKSRDEHRMGLYWLIRGDHNIASPETSPTVLNFHILDDVDDEFGGDSQFFPSTEPYPQDNPTPSFDSKASRQTAHSEWSKKLGTVAHGLLQRLLKLPRLSDTKASLSGDERELRKKISLAIQCYDEAIRFFKLSGSTQGLAAVVLRKACVLFIEDIQVASHHSSTQHDKDVQEYLGVAQQFCEMSGDTQLDQLVQMHQLLTTSYYESQSYPGWVEAAAGLGSSTFHAGNEIFGLCLGLLPLRASLYFRYQCGSGYLCYDFSEISCQLIKSMPVFRTAWYQVMLVQASATKNFGGSHHAWIWSGHLKECMYQLARECEVADRKGALIFLHLLKMTLTATASIDAKIGDASLFPDQETLDLLNLLPTDSVDPRTQSWLEQQAIRIKYHRALALHKNCSQRGDLGDANRSLLTFLQDDDVLKMSDLATRSYLINVLVTYGLTEEAENILNGIEDDANLLPEYITLVNNPTVGERRCAARRRVKSLEILFLCCIKTKVWDRARRLLSALELASPGYFTSVSSYTKLWPWQRCFYAGLVHENGKEYTIALQYFVQSWLFLNQEWRRLGDLNQRRELWENREVARLVGSLTRRQLLWSKDQPEVKKLKPTSDQRIDTRIFAAFAFKVDYGRNPHWKEALMFFESGRSQYVWEAATSQADYGSKLVSAMIKHQIWSELKAKRGRTAEENRELAELEAEKESFTADLRNADASQNSLRHRPIPYSIDELLQAIPPNAIAIYSGLTEDGLTVFVVDRTGIKVAFLVDESPELMRTRVLVLRDLIEKERGQPESNVLLAPLLKSFSSLIISESVARCISAREHVIFVPSGDLR